MKRLLAIARLSREFRAALLMSVGMAGIMFLVAFVAKRLMA